MKVEFALSRLSDQTLDIFSRGLTGKGQEAAPVFSLAWRQRIERERMRRNAEAPAKDFFELPSIPTSEVGVVLTMFARSAEGLPILVEELTKSDLLPRKWPKRNVRICSWRPNFAAG